MNASTLIRFARPETDWERPTYTVQPSHGRRSTAKTFTPTHTTRIEKRRKRTRTFAEDPFRARFGQRLPTGMRQEARGMDWKSFISTYAPTNIRVEQLKSQRLRAGRHHFEIAMNGLAAHGQGTRVSITAMGASSAMTEVLADHGFNVEIREFHQYKIFEATVTFIYATHNSKSVWAVGFGADRDMSIANALCSAASRLYLI
ncbi:hypothetical protein [Corynebacterium anserum]